MEYLDKFVLPHSGANLELLKFLLGMALAIFSIFSGVLFSSTLISIIYKSKYKKSGNENHIRIAIDFANLITTNKNMGVFLGVIPFAVIIILYLQLLHETEAQVVNFLIIGFLLYVIGLVCVYIYKHTLQLNNFFRIFRETGKTKANENISAGIDELSKNSFITNSVSSVWGLILIFLSLWIFVSAITLSYQADKWNGVQSIFTALYSGIAIINFVHFLTISFAVTGTAFIVKYFYWDKRESHSDTILAGGLAVDYSAYSKKISATFAFIFSIPQPLFFGISVFAPSGPSKTFLFFGMMFLVLTLSFFLLILLYGSIRKNKFNTVTYSFYILLLIFSLITIKDQNAFGLATKTQLAKLAVQFEQELAGHDSGIESNSEIDGKAIYENKCMACHAFEQRLVGPPHKEVMAKYKNNQAGMVKFVLNPTKVRPDYPQMPAQGLKPKEAKAVIDFMFKEFGPKLK